MLYNPDGSRTGMRINARVRRKCYMGSHVGDQGPLSTRPTSTEAWEMHEKARARADFGASMAPRGAAAAAPAAKQPDGILVPGRSGGAVWKTKAELDEQRKTKELADARRRAATPGNPEFMGPPAPRKPAIFDGVRGMKGFKASRRQAV